MRPVSRCRLTYEFEDKVVKINQLLTLCLRNNPSVKVLKNTYAGPE